MSTLCLLAAGAVLARVATQDFTLSWTHSVEKTEWRESWRIADTRLVLAEARVKGFGAGVEPPPDARLSDGWLVWTPSLPPQETILLAASTHTADHTLCAAGRCAALHDWLSAGTGPVELRPCR